MQLVLAKHQYIFETLLSPPPQGVHDHYIPFISGILPSNVCPYCHLFAQKNEIENIVQELLATGVIHPVKNLNRSTNIITTNTEYTIDPQSNIE
jgi:hypothetical protein